MATAPDTTSVSVDEYLASSYEPECEYVDGVLEPKPARGYKHARLQLALLSTLKNREEQFNYKLCPEFRIRVGPERFRVPDISVLPGRPKSVSHADVAPLLTIEILSKGESMGKPDRESTRPTSDGSTDGHPR